MYMICQRPVNTTWILGQLEVPTQGMGQIASGFMFW